MRDGLLKFDMFQNRRYVVIAALTKLSPSLLLKDRQANG